MHTDIRSGAVRGDLEFGMSALRDAMHLDRFMETAEDPGKNKMQVGYLYLVYRYNLLHILHAL